MAWSLYVKKRDHLKKLSEIHVGNIPEWYGMDKTPKVVGGEVQSVYRHSVTKGKLDYLNILDETAYPIT
jgi:hypothetical protein